MCSLVNMGLCDVCDAPGCPESGGTHLDRLIDEVDAAEGA